MFLRERFRRLCPVLAAAMALCLCSVSQARQGRGAAGEEQDRQGKNTTFAAAIDASVQACRQQAVDLKGMPLDLVSRVIQLDDAQASQLERMRSASRTAAEGLDGNCPKDAGTQLSEKIAALDRALQVVADSLKSLHPAVASFYSLLGDEQKAQLVAMTVKAQLSASRQKLAGEQADADPPLDPDHKSECLQWEARLRSWPVRQIESATALSDFQRASLYELSAAIYRSAGDLAQACPAANPLTPLGRLEAKENQLRALQQDIEAIQPVAAAFENSLSEDQRNGLLTAIGVPAKGPQTVGSAVTHSRTKRSPQPR